MPLAGERQKSADKPGDRQTAPATLRVFLDIGSAVRRDGLNSQPGSDFSFRAACRAHRKGRFARHCIAYRTRKFARAANQYRRLLIEIKFLEFARLRFSDPEKFAPRAL